MALHGCSGNPAGNDQAGNGHAPAMRRTWQEIHFSDKQNDIDVSKLLKAANSDSSSKPATHACPFMASMPSRAADCSFLQFAKYFAHALYKTKEGWAKPNFDAITEQITNVYDLIKPLLQNGATFPEIEKQFRQAFVAHNVEAADVN